MEYEKIIKLSTKLQTSQNAVDLCYRIIGQGNISPDIQAVFKLVIDELQTDILNNEKTLRIYVGK
jgi:hypothetical protein